MPGLGKIVALIASILFMTGCPAESEDDGFCKSPIEAVFDPAAGWLLPFPSDFFLAEDASTATGFRVNIPDMPSDDPVFAQYPAVREQFNQLDGFGTSAGIVFGFSAEIGSREPAGKEAIYKLPPDLAIGPEDTVKPDSPVVLMCVSEGSPDYGKVVPLYLDYVSEVSPLTGAGQYYLSLEPAFPLRPQTTYAAAVTRRAAALDGSCIAPSAGTKKLLSGKDPGKFGILGKEAPAALSLLVEKGFIEKPQDVSAMTIFTTQSIEEELVAAAREIIDNAKSDPPGVVQGSLVAEPGSNGAALVVKGRFPALNFQTGKGTFEIEDGKPAQQGEVELEFELVVPEETEEHKPPFPVIIYQHGLMGEKEEDMGAKRAQAKEGFASLAIDAVLHGTRAAPEGIEAMNFFGIDLETKTFDMPRLRDNFRQSFLDIVSLAEIVPSLSKLDLLPEGAPDGRSEIAAEPVYLSGHSLGATIAAGAIALTPRVPVANLCAGGGSLLTNLFMRSEIFSYFIDMLKPKNVTEADIRRFMPIIHALVERGDPVNLARLAIDEPSPDLPGMTPKHVLFQEVIDDSYVPNSSNEALGRALGLSHLDPVIREVFGLDPVPEPASLNGTKGTTAVFFQFDRLENGEPAAHTQIYADPVAQEQWIHLFATHRDAGKPEAEDPYRVLGIPGR